MLVDSHIKPHLSVRDDVVSFFLSFFLTSDISLCGTISIKHVKLHMLNSINSCLVPLTS